MIDSGPRHEEFVSSVDSTGSDGVDVPDIAVVIPSFDRGPQVLALARRILAEQSHPNFALVVVDDGSNDHTVRLLRSIVDSRLTVVARPHEGVSAARNAGAMVADADWLVFLDSDDEVDSDWLASFVELMTPETDIVSIGLRRSGASSPVVRSPAPNGGAFGDLPALWQAGAFGIRRSLFWQIGGYSSDLSYSENTELALRVGARHRTDPVRAAIDHAPHYTVHVRSNRYDPGVRLESAEYILDRHRAALADDRAFRATYHAMAGVAAMRLERRRTAAGHLVRAIALRPWRVKNLLRLARIPLPT